MDEGPKQLATRPFTLAVRATSLAEAMVRAKHVLTAPSVHVVEIVDASLQIGDNYVITAVLSDVPAAEKL